MIICAFVSVSDTLAVGLSPISSNAMVFQTMHTVQHSTDPMLQKSIPCICNCGIFLCRITSPEAYLLSYDTTASFCRRNKQAVPLQFYLIELLSSKSIVLTIEGLVPELAACRCQDRQIKDETVQIRSEALGNVF